MCNIKSWIRKVGVSVLDSPSMNLKGNDIHIWFVPLQFLIPIQNPIHDYSFTNSTHNYSINLNPYVNTNINETNMKYEISWIWISIIVIQKTSTKNEIEGEADKGEIPLSDRTTSLDIPNASSLEVEGSGAEDVDAEGVRILFFLKHTTPWQSLFKYKNI